VPQDDRSTTPSTPLTALANRWWLAAVLAVVGGAAGAGFATLQPTTYTGEARVTVGSESLDARVVAGYSIAATQLASDISRYVNDQQAQSSLEPLLGDAAADVSSVAASPIADSSVIRIEVQASSASAASDGAQAIAQQLTDQVNAVSGETADTLLQQYTDLSNQVAGAQQAADDAKANFASLTGAGEDQAALDAARGAVVQTGSALSVLQVQQQALGTRYRNAVTSTPAAAGLRIVQNGAVSGDDTSSRLQKYGLAGVVGGILLALIAAVVLDRRRASRARLAADPSATADTDGPSTPEPTASAGRTTLDVERAARTDARRDLSDDPESRASRP
jgi:hypothetical protein